MNDQVTGQVIDSYKIIRRLGEGGMGAVFEAEHRGIGHRAAIKILHSTDRALLARFLNEACAVNRVSHPGIVSVYHHGVLPSGQAYIVMEFLDGEPLSARLRRSKRMAVADVRRLGQQMAAALTAAHAQGIVHRDLKPDNIMIVADPDVLGGERAKIVDFGLVKLIEPPAGGKDSLRTRTGMVMGTPVYMSPEQCRDAGTAQDRSDVYSLGVVFYEMLSGHPPFRGATAADLIMQHLMEVPRSLSEVAGVPAVLARLVESMLEKSPQQRPRMAQVLARFTALEVGAGERPSRAVGEVHGPSRTPRALASLAIGLVVAVCLIFALRLVAPGPPRRAPTPEDAPAESLSMEIDLDASALLKEATTAAQRIVVDAQLTALVARCAQAGDGARCVGDITFLFRSPLRSRQALLPCLVQVVARPPLTPTASSIASAACKQRILGPPRCSLREVWKRTAQQVEGPRARGPVTVTYKDDRWTVTRADRSATVLDDC